MKNSRTEEAGFDELADIYNVKPETVRCVVNSFFDSIVFESRKLPFDNPRKIFSKSAFDKHVVVRSIPFIGRIGPVYSKYLKWRSNVSKDFKTVPRPKSGSKLLPEEIEAIAEIVLNGGEYEGKPKRNVSFKRIWLVGEQGKTQAKQVIPKTEKIK